MIYLYTILIHNPLLSALIFFYQTIALKDLGVAIIFLTILVRILLYPLFQKSTRHQMMMQRLQPKIKEIQEKHKDSRAKQGEAMLELYKSQRINPLSGIFLIILQLPILIALYRIFLTSFDAAALGGVYGFITAPATLNPYFLGLINLQESNIFIVGIAAVAQYIQGKTLMSRQTQRGGANQQQERMMRMMLFLGPVLTVVFLGQLPAAVGLYWLTTSVISVLQQLVINRQLHHHEELGNIRENTN